MTNQIADTQDTEAALKDWLRHRIAGYVGRTPEDIRTDVTKVPLLGDLPVLGNVFKTTSRSNNKTELLIFLTPRVLKETVNAVK